MGNIISSDRVPGAAPLHMSNGLTAVFLDVLVIAGSDLAKSPWEKRLVYWLAEHDQTRTGVGVVGFDMAAMGWTRESFAAERQFVLSLIDAALRRHGWDRLPFAPNDELLRPALVHFRELVSRFSVEAITGPAPDVWAPDESENHGWCEEHRVFLHESGCIVCNDRS